MTATAGPSAPPPPPPPPPGPSVSVVIPCWNAEPWLAEALASVAAQTRPAAEVIVVDDGSTDRSPEMARGTAGTRLLVTSHAGPSVARNAGIEAASGDWVAFLDADDAWKPDHLERFAALAAGTGVAAYLAGAEHYSIRARRVVSRSDPGPLASATAGLDHPTYLRCLLRHGMIQMSATVARRDRLLAIGGFDPALRYGEDVDLWLRLVHGETWAYEPTPTCVYRCANPQSLSQQRDAGNFVAKLRVLAKNCALYGIPKRDLAPLARTTLSRAIMVGDRDTRREAARFAWPFLSLPVRVALGCGLLAPPVYRLANGLRNCLRGPVYPPRREVAGGAGGGGTAAAQ